MENKSSSITPTEIKVNGNNARSSNEDDEKKDREASARRRKNIVDEICSTERAYVNNLDTLVNIYMNPLKSEGMLTEDQFKVIFCDIKVILQYNNSLVGRIEERVANYDDRATKLGDIFILMADFLKVYTRYVNNYNDAQTVLRSKLEDSKFVQFLHSRKELNKGLDINDYLIMPVQRIPRYNLLLNDLVRNTPSDHPDFADLTKAKSRIEEVATFVNEQKRVVENLAKVSDIIASITGLDIKFKLLSPTRRFLREGEMNQTVIDSTDKTTYYFFLFNDLLVWTKKKKNVSKYVFNRLLYLIDMDVRLGFLEGKPGIGLTLDDKKVVLLGKNEEDTDSWFNDLVSARAIILESESKTVVEKRKTFIHEELLQHHSDSKKETKTIKGFNSFFKSRNNSNERASKDKNMTMVASKDLKAALVSFANTPSPAKPNTPSPTLPAKTTDTSTATSESRVRAATAHMNSLQAPKHNSSSEFPLKNTSPNSSTGSSKPPPPSHPPPPRSILRPVTPTGQSPSGTPPPKTPPPPVVAPVLPPTTTSVTSPELRMKKSHSQTINFTKSQNNLFPKGVRYDGTPVPTTASKSDSKLDTIPKIDKENKDKDKESKPFGSFFSSIKFGGGAKKPDHVISNPVNVSKGTLPIPLLAQIQSHKEHGSTQPNGSNDDLEQQRLRSISSAEAEIATAGQRRRSMTTSN